MFNRIFTVYKNNTWVYPTMPVAITILVVFWWVVSDTLSAVSENNPANDTRRVEENNAGNAVSPYMVLIDQDHEIIVLKVTLRDLKETVRMLMNSITYLDSNLIRARVLSVRLNGEQQATVA